MSDVLERILARKRDEVAAAKARISVAELFRQAYAPDRPPGDQPRRPFLDAMRTALAQGVALIGEIKRRSPSHGLIRADFDAARIARAYAAGGATCLSVLTDGPDFGGSLADLKAARAASGLPVLRKDFIIDEWQLAEAQAAGADCALVIVAAVGAEAARALTRAAMRDFGLDVLLEVASEAELDSALKTDAVMIGVNARCLRTLAMDPDRTLRLAPRVPADRIAIALSGLQTRADLARHVDAGVRAFLVGEALMREADIEAATRRLLAGHG
jgi:indole-3-glycerol phosphate synthase